MPSIEIIDKKNIEESLKQGLWATGPNKYVKISEISEIDYLQKILYTLSKREEKAYSLHEKSILQLEIAAKLYVHVLDRLLQLKTDSKPINEIKLLGEPIIDTVCDKDLESLKLKINEKLLSLGYKPNK
jgi:hypothetical protein